LNAAFLQSAATAARLWERWCSLAEGNSRPDSRPSVLDLQTVCREYGFSLADLDSYARVQHELPVLLVCGGEPLLIGVMAAALNLKAELPTLPAQPLLWRLLPGKGAGYRIKLNATTRDVTLPELVDVLRQRDAFCELMVVEQVIPTDSAWSLTWLPHPQLVRTADYGAADVETLLAQRAAVIVTNDTPEELRADLTTLGQKIWCLPQSELASADDRTRLLRDIVSLLDDREEDLEIRATATWGWLTNRLYAQIELQRGHYQQLLNQYEMRAAQTRHLLAQYRTNWGNGVRSVVETYLQSRGNHASVQAFSDPQKAAPQAGTFLTALALPALWSKLDEFITDLMANFVAGLAGLAARVDLRRITLGDVNARWETRALASRLETVLNEKRVFPAVAAKSGGLVGKMTGRSQVVQDERKAQVAKALRLIPAIIEAEFSNWSGVILTSVEKGVILQLAAGLANKGFPDEDGLRRAMDGLNRFETLLRGGATVNPTRTGDDIAGQWLRLLSTTRLPEYTSSSAP
jgi:hypothetical protein